jgi:hypothetical protein
MQGRASLRFRDSFQPSQFGGVAKNLKGDDPIVVALDPHHGDELAVCPGQQRGGAVEYL